MFGLEMHGVFYTYLTVWQGWDDAVSFLELYLFELQLLELF